MTALRITLFLAAGAILLPAQNLADFEKRVTEFTLPNGLHFLVAERHEAPVVSFDTLFNAGSAEDSAGETGLAHLMERLLFKGTESIGTRDWPSEKRALEALEEVADRRDAERNKGPRADAAKLTGLEAEFKVALDRAESFAVANQYPQILHQNGAVDLRAGASYDTTEVRYTLPSNRLELWFLLESQRLLHPVFRDFYQERDRMADQDGAALQATPQAQLAQYIAAAAFFVNPYRKPELGWPGDVAALRASEAKAFFEKYCVPANMTIAIAGDVNPADARRLAERYFGPLPAKPLPELPRAAEPPQNGPRSLEVYSPAQPFLLVAYKRPDMFDHDAPVFEVLRLILSNERTGMLTRQLVERKGLARVVRMYTPYPHGRYPNLVLFLIAPAPNHTPAENEKALTELLTTLQTQRVETEALAGARAQARAAAVRALTTNSGLASSLAEYQADYGDWRKLFSALDDWNKVAAEDVQRVARLYFVPNGRTVVTSGPRPVPGVSQ